MSALTAARSTKKMGQDPIVTLLEFNIAATTELFQGGIVVIDASGNAVAGGTAGAFCAGMAKRGRRVVATTTEAVGYETLDNNPGSAGDVDVQVEQGVFKFGNSTAADAIAAGDVGYDCYVVDDQTVAKLSTGTRVRAGKVVQVDSDGVWVEMRATEEKKAPIVVTIPVDLVSITAAGDVLTTWTPGFRGRIKKMEFFTTKPVTTGSKLASLNAEIGTTDLTGGVVALTSANCTPLGARVAGSAVTAANYFGDTDTVSIEAASVTAFSEGQGVLVITIEPA